MIEKMIIGNKYSIFGVKPWSDLNIDVNLISMTVYSQLDKQDVDLYQLWFEEYGISETIFEDTMKDDPFIYICKKITSRSPATETTSGKYVYLFPALIDYSKSEKLLECESYQYLIQTSPSQETDSLNPYNIMTDTKIRRELTQKIQSMIYDGNVTTGSTITSLLPESEYNLFNKNKAYNKLKVQQNEVSSQALNDERMHMYNIVQTNEQKQKELNDLNVELNNRIYLANELYNKNVSFSNELLIKESQLKNKYEILKEKIKEYNKLNPDNPIQPLPEKWEDL